MTAEALNFLSIEGEPPVTYSRVIEFLSDKSYTVYDMYSPLDRPDGQNNQNANYYSCKANLPAIFNSVNKHILVGALGKNSSCALERGQIKEIRIYDSSNTLKRSVIYTYSSNPGRYNQYVSSIYITDTSEQRMAWLAFELGLQYLNNSALSFALLHSYCIYTFPVFLEEEKTTDYYGSQSITNTTRYRYNSKKLKSTVITYDSRGDSLKTIIRYPSDINTGVYANMNTLNMLNFPVEQITLKNNKYTGSRLTTYKAASSTNYVPDKIYSLEITSPLTSFTYYNGSSYDSHYGTTPEITYDNYGTSGNLRQITGRDNVPNSWLWDASGIYPMAQVRGATYSQISSYDEKTCDYPGISLWTGLNNIVPTALFSTYSYKPLTGIVSATDARGITTNYTYDISRRLFMVRDDDKNILNRYRYGYRNYPDNGLGGYSPATAYLSKPAYVIKGNSSSGKVIVSGGSGSFSYNWYLKTSSGSLAASSLNSSSDTFIFTCSQTGTYYMQCEVTDNLLGKKITCYTGNFTCCVSVCSFATNTGFSNLSGSVFNYGTATTVSFTFCTTLCSQMFPIWSDLSAQVAVLQAPGHSISILLWKDRGKLPLPNMVMFTGE
jgi:YD repeat-containing protein